MSNDPVLEKRDGIGAYGNHIGGAWVAAASGNTIENRNPTYPDEVIGHFADSGSEDVDAAVTAAEGAFAGWAGTSAIARANILYKASEILASRIPEIGRDLSREEGKTLKEGIGETTRAVAILRYFAGEIQQPIGEQYSSMSPSTLLFTLREPIGVCGIITPWNFPIAIPAWKAVPALAFGNTVVMKPASLTPLSAVHLTQALVEAGLPDGALNLVTGGGKDVGDPLVADERVAAISFTGSDVVGNALKKVAGDRGAKVQLELGGKNPAIVLADADLDQAVTQVINGAMMSTGQKCTATSRAIVDRRVAGELAERLGERVSALKVGDPLDDATNLGPVISQEAADRLVTEVEDAADTSATLSVGGGRPEGLAGHFVNPTLFLDVESDSRLGQVELFGPVLGVIAVDGIDEAISVANSVKFGLSASLFTRDIQKALSFIQTIQAGIVHVNSETAGAEPHVPFGGYKGSSSYSREQGKASREFYTQVKTVYFDPPPSSGN